jgi:peroxiredoxin
MARSDNLYALPPDLPVPIDDGAADHLTGMTLPSIPLAATDGSTVNLAALTGRTVVYAYPRTGRPDQEVPASWNAIPGARGCTPQTCAFRDHHAEFAALGTRVFGFSTQTTEYQREVVERLHLPFAILSDADLRFTHALRLPTFEFGGETLTKRLTLVIRDGRIEKVFYPVFPSDKNAEEVLNWMS